MKDRLPLREVKAMADGYELDMFSTMLSRKYSHHVCIGSRRYVKVRKEDVIE